MTDTQFAALKEAIRAARRIVEILQELYDKETGQRMEG